MIKQIYKFLSPKYQNLFLEYKVIFKPRYGYEKPIHQQLFSIINTNKNNYRNLLNRALALKEQIWTINDSGKEKNPIKPTWNNGFLPGLDIIGIYTMLTVFKPKKYIEIGSGNSTKVAYKAKKDHNLDTEIISIDPEPRAEIDSIADRVYHHRFEEMQLDLIEQLNENDILFVDNSHRILPNSDSMVFFLEVLPRLKKGVIVQIHDIYLPYDYPQFMCDRFYSEQYGLAMYLLANPEKYQSILPNYFIFRDKELSDVILPVWDHDNLKNVEKHGGSFWLRINQ